MRVRRGKRVKRIKRDQQRCWSMYHSQIGQFVIMKSLFSLEADIEGKTIKIEVGENLDIFTIARSIAQEHSLDTDSEEEIMIVILQTLTDLMDSNDTDLKARICRILDNTIHHQTPTPSSQSTSSSTSQHKPPAGYFESNHKHHPTSINPHKRTPQTPKTVSLYDRALKSKQNRQQISRETKQIEEEEEIKHCTFQPQINRQELQEYPPGKRHEILYKNASLVREKQERKRKEKKEHETDGYTFCPEINEQSVRMAKNRSHVSYKREYYQEDFPFHPILSKGTQKIAEGFPNFDQRLEMYTNKAKRSSSPDKEKENSFTSQSCKEEKQDKYKSLFNDEEKDQERRMKLYGLLPASCKHTSNTPKSEVTKNVKSEQLFARKKVRIFNFIFECVSWEGIVDQESIENNSLPRDIIVVLEPLLNEIGELEVSLNHEQFLNSLERLYRSLSSIDKQMVVNLQTKQKWRSGQQEYKNQFNFTPTISIKSKGLAIRRELRPLADFTNYTEQSFESRYTIHEEEEDQDEEDEDQEEIQLM